MATARTTTMRLTADDDAILEAAQQRNGLLSRSEALRYVLRHYARAEGIELTRPKPKPKTKRK